MCAAAAALACRANSFTLNSRKQTCNSQPWAPSFRDNLRGFFDKCFPNLLKRIFGYDDFEASWLNMVTKVGVYQRNASPGSNRPRQQCSSRLGVAGHWQLCWPRHCNGASTHAAVPSQPHKEEDARALVNLLHPQGRE